MKNYLKTIGIIMSLAFAGLLAGCADKDNSSTLSSSTTSRTNVSSMNDGTNSMIADVDNTRKNVRDRNNANVTPLDQGNSPSDLNVTKQIRQILVSTTNNYSMTAQNIKIITKDGKVTLRGPVTTETEKSSIVACAKTVAGDGNVDDQLDVKTNQ